jgi:hypothetical protein
VTWGLLYLGLCAAFVAAGVLRMACACCGGAGVSTCCCANPLPRTLHVTLTDDDGDNVANLPDPCTGMGSKSYPVTYDPVNDWWAYPGPILDCPTTPGKDAIRVVCSQVAPGVCDWSLFVNGSDVGAFGSGTCDPLHVEWDFPADVAFAGECDCLDVDTTVLTL